VLTFVIGLGLSCAVFTLINGLFFRAQVTHDPASFVQVYAQASGDCRPDRMGTPFAVTREYFSAAQRQARTLSALTVSRWASFKLDAVDGNDLRGQFVVCNYLAAVIWRHHAGAGLGARECRDAAPRAKRRETTRDGSPRVVGCQPCSP
jgi:hypothetical protein